MKNILTKHNIVFFCLNIISCTVVYSQSPCSTDHTFTTDPDAQSNNKFPLRPNYFRWVGEETFDIYSDAINNPNTIASPYFQDGNPVINIHKEFKDYKIEDGWELIREEFGYQYDANGNKTQRNQPQTNPFVVFYNRYTGTIRVFTAIGTLLSAYQSVGMRLTYDNTTPFGFKTNMIHDASQTKPLVALDKVPEGIPEVISVSSFSNTRRHWFYADFTAVYDPCTCLNKSLIGVYIELIQSAKIEFETDGILIDDNSTSVSLRENAGSTSIGLKDLVEGGKKAYEQYKSVHSFTSKELDAIDNLKNQSKLGTDAAVKAFTGLSSLQKFLVSKPALITLAKVAPFVAAAIPFIDLLISGGNKNQGANPPKVMRMTTKSSGYINSIDLHTIYFGNPGGASNGEFAAERRPYYNYPLGVFNILKTPKLNYHVDNNITVFNQSSCFYLDNKDRYRYRLNEDDIRYIVNPASGLKWENAADVEIYASLVFEFDDLNFENNTEEFLTKGGFRYKFTALNSMIDQVGPGLFTTKFVPLGCLRDVYADFELRRYETYFRGNCNYNIWNPPPHQPVAPTLYPQRISVKLMALLKRQDANQNAKDVLYTGKYYSVLGDEKTDDSDWNSTLLNVPKELILNSNIAASQRIAAWEKITIDAGFNVSTTDPITITAGEEIIVTPGTTVPSNVILEINSPVECTNVIAPLSAGTIQSFCQTGAYNRADREFNKSGSKDDVDKAVKSEIASSLLYDAYPNPFGTETTLRYSIGQTSKVELYITDAFGQRIATLVDMQQQGRGVYDVSFGNNDLPAGVYYYTLRTDTFSQTKKIILIK